MSLFLAKTTHRFGILLALVLAVLVFKGASFQAFAAPNEQINYQGKLTDTTGAAVGDADYNLRFWLYDTAGAATTSAVWTEEWLVGSSNGITITNGLFSVMLGSTTALSGVDFNQTLYLGVEVGGTGATPAWDGEMSPRKVLGTVPAAFEAQQLDGLATTSFLRADQADTMEATESGTLLTLIQNGTGAIFDAVNSAADSVFKIFDSGVVTIGTSTADSIATSTGLAVYNKDLEIRTGTGTPMWGVGSINDTDAGGPYELDGARDLVVVGDYAYVVTGFLDDGVQILDISDPTNPIGVGSIGDLDAGGPYELDGAYDIGVQGNYAYVASFGDDGVQILDISDPSNPVGVGSIDDTDAGGPYELDGPTSIAVSGNYVYVAAYTDNGVQILDISDPTNPIGVGSIEEGVSGADELTNPTSIAISGNYAYVTSATDNGVQVIDISDPTNPIGVGSIDDADPGEPYELQFPRGIVVAGNFAYVTGASDNGLQIIDISDPTNPIGVGEIDDADAGGPYELEEAWGVAVSGNYAFVTGRSDDGVQIVDISSSTNPVGVGSISDDTNGATALASPMGLTVLGNYLYVVGNLDDGVQILDLGGLITPTAEIGNLLANDIETNFLRVTQALVADSLNINTNALIGGSLTISGSASSSLLSTNTNPALTVLSGYVGIGTTTPYADLSVVGDIALTGSLFDTNASSGTNGYVLQTTGSSVTWVATSSLGISGGGSSLFTDDGDITYLTSLTDVLAIGTTTDIATSTGLAVYNRDIEIITGTGTPMVGVGSISDGDAGGPYELDGAQTVVVVGDYAYVASSDDHGVQILDISDPTNPVGVGYISDLTNGADELNGAWDIAVSGNYAYVVGFLDDGVQVLDISDPTNPTGVSSIRDDTNGATELDGPNGITIAGNYAYIASSVSDGVQILDISDPTNLVGIGAISNGAGLELDGPYDIAVAGNYAYVTSYVDDALQVIDVSDPTNPVGVGSIIDENNGATELNGPNGITVSGNYAYVASYDDSGVQIVDISDPTNPTGVGSINDDTNGALRLSGAERLALAGSYLFVASSIDDGVQILDVSSTTNPVGVGSISSSTDILLDGAYDVSVVGNYLYVSSASDDSLQILDLGGLITPTAEIGNLLSNDINTDYLRVTQALTADSLNINTNALIGGSLTISGSASSSLLSTNTNPALTVLSGYVGIGTTTPYADLSVAGDIALTGSLQDTNASSGESGTILQSTGSAVSWISESDLGLPTSLFTDGGDITYLTSLTDVLAIGTTTDIATSTGLAVYNKDVEILAGDPVGVGAFSDSDNYTDIAVVGNYAYVTAEFSVDVEILDISDPTNPVSVGTISDGENNANELSGPYGIAISGNYAYVAAYTDDGVQVLDISDPTNPIGVGSISNNGSLELNGPEDIAIQGNYAYVTASVDDGVQVLDITDPTNPVAVGSVTDGDPGATELNGAAGIAVRGNYAYVAANVDNGFQVLDISDPTNPIGVASINDTASLNLTGPWDVALSGNYAYVVNDGFAEEFQIFDISDPTNPVGVGQLADGENGADTLSALTGLAISGDYVFALSDGENGVQVLDISSTTNPVGVGSITDGNGGATELNGPYAIDIQGNYAYIASYSDTGIQVLDIGGLITPTAEIGNLLANDINTDYLRVTQALTADSLNINTNALIGGSLTISGSASSSLLSTNTNPALTVLSGYVGIGTTTPYADLSVAGDIAVTGSLFDSTASAGTSGQVLQTTGSATTWVSTSSLNITPSLFTDGGDITYLTSLTDVLSIGTTTDIETSTGLAVYNRDIEIITGTGTPMWGIGSISDNENGANTLQGARDVVVVGGHAYVVSTVEDGIQVLDISDPTNPTGIGSITDGTNGADALDGAYNIAIAGNYAYVTSDIEDSVQIIDISDPTQPVGVGSIASTSGALLDGARGISVSGKYAYVASYIDDGVQVIDISDPTNPIGVGSITDGAAPANELNGARGITVVGSYAYVAAFDDDGVQIIDISDPTNPIGVGSITDGAAPANELNGARGITVVGSYAYVSAREDDGLQILDISDPTNPIGVGSIQDGTNGADVLNNSARLVVLNNYLYVAGEDDNGVQVLDISSSTNPIGVGSIINGANGADELVGATGLAISGNYAYVTAYDDNGVQILDLGGLITPTAEIGNLLSNDIETNFLRVTQALVADSLNVNTNSLIGGSLSITGTASSTLIDTNQLTALSIASGFIEVGTTTATSGIKVGYGAICVDNDGECSATTTGRISSVSTYSGNSDLAETYFSADPLEPGDIVQLQGELSVQQANPTANNTIIGVVSTKPGVLLGFDDISTNEGESQYPIALKGRVPVKVSTENGPVEPGDQLMLSSVPGTAMKATGTGAVVGIALEAFNPEDTDSYYSDTFINQYTDDIPVTEDIDAIIDELTDTPLERETITATSTEANEDTTEVQVGQIIMFVDLSYRYVDERTNQALNTLMGTTTEEHQGDNEKETILERLTSLANSFVGGVLRVLRLEAKKVELTDKLCVDNTCIKGDDLRVLIDSLDEGTQITVFDEETTGDVSVDMTEPVPTASASTSTTTNTNTSATSTETSGNSATTTETSSTAADHTTASTTDSGSDTASENTTETTDITEAEEQEEDTESEEVEEITESTTEPEEPAEGSEQEEIDSPPTEEVEQSETEDGAEEESVAEPEEPPSGLGEDSVNNEQN